MIRPVPDATADAVVDVQVQRTGGESRLKDEEVVLFFLAEKRAERTCGEGKMATPGWTEKKRSSAPMRRGSVPQKIYWEGINLNKISKKIVSLVTMAAFALTLVPAAAFAAPVGNDPNGAEDISITGNDQAVVETTTGTATVELNIAPNGTLSSSNSLVFWAVKDGAKTDDVSFAQNGVGLTIYNGWDYMSWLENGSAATSVVATFSETGTYTLYAANYTGSSNFADDEALTEAGAELGNVTVVTASDVVDVDGSRLLIDGSQNAASATEGTPVTVEFDVDGTDGYALNAAPDTAVYVWVENGNNRIVDDATFTGATLIGNNVWKVDGDVLDGHTITATFNDNGDGYEIHAAVGPDKATVPAANELDEIRPIVVNVAAAAVDTEIITFDATQADGTVDGFEGAYNNTTWIYTIDDDVVANDVKTYTVTGVAYEDYANGIAAEEQELTVSSSDDDITIVDSTIETNNKGEFSFSYTCDDYGTYDIVVADLDDNVKATLSVVHPTVAPADITTTEDGGVLLAGNDINYIENPTTYMSDALQFALTDTYGHDQSGVDVLVKEAAHNLGATNHADYIKVDAAEGSTLSAADLILDWDPEANAYTLAYVNNGNNNPAADFVAGEYTVEVSLNNGEKAKASFTVANFGEIEELTLDLTAAWRNDTTAQNDSITVLDEQVALGQRVIVEPMYVDANGLKIKADDVSLTAEGAAVESRHLSGADRYFDLFWNIPSNQSLIGTVVTVQAYDETNHNYVERELTVVDAYQNETLAFDPTQGEVGESNTVNVTVEANDAISKVNGTMSAYIASQSNEEATIDLDVQKNVVNGEGKLFLQSDAEGTVDVVVAVKANNGEIYANTLTFTFGDEDPYAGSYIVMTIGSDQYLINGEMFDGSVDNLGAPYVDSAWRTMVPVRVLAESFGANVDYADNVVTIVDGDTTVVMNIGEETYTVNGEEKAMDTAAVIGDDDRTYVPVRFVAEALGYSVTPLYDANGLTSSVHFSK